MIVMGTSDCTMIVTIHPAMAFVPPEELTGVPTVCGSPRQALTALEEDRDFLKAGDVFSDDLIDGYMELKWEEVYNFEHTPHPVEWQMYYSS